MGEVSVPHGVDPAMKAMEPAGPRLAAHLVLGKSKCIELAHADDPVLSLSQAGDSSGGVNGAFFGHMASNAPLVPI